MSRIDPFLPLNWLAAAARLTVPAASPSALRVADPNFSASSQKTKRTPRGAVDNGTKPTLTASDIGNSSRSGLSPGRKTRRNGPKIPPSRVRQTHASALWPATRGTAKQRGRQATSSDLLTNGKRPRHSTAILLTDQRDGSESQSRLDETRRNHGEPEIR